MHRFLWKLQPEDKVRVYKWSGKNDYVALCEPEYISFGGGYVSLFHCLCSEAKNDHL